MALTEKQIAARLVGGSDVATILGINPYMTAYELYYEKRGETPPRFFGDNENVEAGNILENGIAEITASRMSKAAGREIKLRRSNITLVNPKYPWLTVHIDRDVVGEDRGVEIKNVGWRAAWAWGDEGTDQIPDYYLPQPHTYMLVKDYPVWTVAAYLGGSELRLYEVQRDKEMDEIIIEKTHDFWFDHVLKGIPVELDVASRAALPALRKVYPGTDGTVVEGNDQLFHWHRVLREAKANESLYKKAGDVAQAHLEAKMGAAAILKMPDGSSYTRKEVKKKAFSVEATTYMMFKYSKPKGESMKEIEDE